MADGNETVKAYQEKWGDVQRAADALGQAGDLIAEAHVVLDRFCPSSDQANWDRAFAWKISELPQAKALCRKVEAHLRNCVAEAAAEKA